MHLFLPLLRTRASLSGTVSDASGPARRPAFSGNPNGFSQSTPYVATPNASRTAANNLLNPFPSGILQPPGAWAMGMLTFVGQGPNFTHPRSQAPYVHQFSFGIQRQFPGSTVLDVAYVGSRSMARNTLKGFNELSAKALTLGNPFLGGNPNLLNQKVPNPFAGYRLIQRHSCPLPTASPLPPVHGLQCPAVEGISTTIVQSGDPMRIPGNVLLPGDPRLRPPTFARLFKTGPPFSLRTTPLRCGNLRNMWAPTVDLSMIKNTRIHEDWNLQFRMDAFNAFNTPVFSSDPHLDPTSPNFSRVFPDNGQSNFRRNVRLGIRFVFSQEVFMDRRLFLGASLAASVPSAPTQAPAQKKMIGIQVGAVSFVDEGVTQVLDILQERAHVNTLFIATFTYGRGIAGRQVPGQPFPDHGKQEYDLSYHGGNFTKIHPQYYRNTVFRDFRAPDHGDFDVLEAVLPEAKKRGLKVFCWYEDVFRSGLPNIEKLQERTLSGRNATTLCLNNPDYRGFLTGLTEDYLRSYPVDGVMWGSERQGAFSNALGASHGGGARDPEGVTCFCDFCLRKGRQADIRIERVRQGFTELARFVRAARSGPRPTDGYYVTLWRLMLRYPELLAWEMFWTDSLRETYRAIYETAKKANPNAMVGWHIWHNNSFNPIYRAEQDFLEISKYSDFLKIVIYHNCGGERLARYVNSVSRTLYADLTPQESLDFHYRVLDYREKQLDQIPTSGLSADYVYRETRRARAGLQGTRTLLWPGIDIDIPTDKQSSKSTPQGTRDAVLGAFRAGADGVLLSRKYSEMRLANLSGAGEAIRQLGIA